MGTMGDSGVSTATEAAAAAVGAPGGVNGAVAYGDDGHTVGNSNGVFKSRQVWWSGFRTSNTVWDAWLVAAAGQVSIYIRKHFSSAHFRSARCVDHALQGPLIDLQVGH